TPEKHTDEHSTSEVLAMVAAGQIRLIPGVISRVEDLLADARGARESSHGDGSPSGKKDKGDKDKSDSDKGNSRHDADDAESSQKQKGKGKDSSADTERGGARASTPSGEKAAATGRDSLTTGGTTQPSLPPGFSRAALERSEVSPEAEDTDPQGFVGPL